MLIRHPLRMWVARSQRILSNCLHRTQKTREGANRCIILTIARSTARRSSAYPFTVSRSLLNSFHVIWSAPRDIRLTNVHPVMFTMPWSPTQAFPHPLASIHSTSADPSVANFMSYPLVSMLTVQGLGGIINDFREHVLGMDAVSIIWAPYLISTSRIPFTYCW